VSPAPADPGFDHIVELTVRFGDLDALGHLNNVAVVTMLETGRVEFWHDLGLTDGAGRFVLAALHVDYRSQGYFRDGLALGTRVARVGRTSFTLGQRLWRTDDDVTIADAEAVLVVLGEDRKTPTPIPDTWRALLTSSGADAASSTTSAPPRPGTSGAGSGG
jgi:acyl-CoA thioester hydrolase